MRKLLSIAAVVIGVVLIVGAAVIRWAVAPAEAVLPSDTNSTRNYTGTATTLFNQAALTKPGLPILLKNVPIAVTHTTKVLGTKGSNALVSDAGSVLVANQAVAGFSYRYAVNRTSMQLGSGYSDVVKQTGISFNWPIRTQKKDYIGWVSDTRGTTPLKYAGTARRGGLSTYKFTTDLPAAPITDPATLKQLPASLPKASVTALSAGLGLSAGQLALLKQALPSLPDPVPFSYTYAVTATYWIEPNTGEVVDLQERETRTLGLALGAAVVPVTPVIDINYTSSPDELAATVKDIRHDANLVTLVYRTLPLSLGIAGVVFLVLGLLGLTVLRSRRDPGPGAAPADSENHFQPV